MKRLYQLLSLLLLFVAGTGVAVAQDWKQGDLLTTTEEAVSGKVVLYAPGTSGDHPSGYMDVNTGASSVVTDDNIWEFEAVGRQVDGHELYYLKQSSTGKYIADIDDATAADPQPTVSMTSDKSEAIALTVLPFEEVEAGTATTRTSATSAKQQLNEVGFVLCREAKYSTEAKDEDCAGNYLYIGGLAKPFYSPYADTNVWQIYSLAETSAQERMSTYGNYYFPDGMEGFPAGTEPGYYTEAAVAQATAAYEAYNKAYENMDNLTDAELLQVCADLKAAYEALHAEGAQIPLSAGYYFIHSVSSRWLTTATKQHKTTGNEVEFLWTKDGYTANDPLATSDVAYIWKVTPAEEGDQFYVQNLLTGSYLNGASLTNVGDYGVSTDDGIAYIVGAEGPLKITLTGTKEPASWVLQTLTPTANSRTQLHAKFTDGAVMDWDAADSENNCFHFTAVSAGEAEALVEAAKQAVINDALTEVYGKATSAYNGAKSYTNAAPEDENFDGEGRLITSSEQLFSENKSTAEGSYEGLVDGDFTTYYHSDWSSAFTPSLSKYHYVGVDLGAAATSPVTVKMAKRATYNDYPTEITFLGSNDAVITKDAGGDVTAVSGTWDVLGASKVDWKTPIGETANAIGYASADVTGYRYLKLAATGTIYNESDPNTNRGYFALSELNIWPGSTYDEANSLLAIVSEATRTELETQLAAAKAELAAGKATYATIDALTAAYEKFETELPEPSRLTAAIEEAETYANGITEDMLGDNVGYYPAEALATLKAAIEEFKAYDATGKDAATINAKIAEVEAAVATFKASVHLPAAGSFYTLRSLSEKGVAADLNTGDTGAYMAQVYSQGTNLTAGLKWTSGNHLDENDFTAVKDTVSATENLQYLWYIEQSEGGKLAIRNVGTGMFIKAADGKISQSATPVECSIVLAGAGKFAIEAGESGGVMQYFNCKCDGSIVTWKAYTGDSNSWWAFDWVTPTNITASSTSISATAGEYSIVTLPCAVSGVYSGTAYSLVGKSEDGTKLILADMEGEVPAGTPFILLADEELGEEGVDFDCAFEGGDSFREGGKLIYPDGELKVVNGLHGVLYQTEKPGAGFGCIAGGKVIATASGTTIGITSGWIDGTDVPVTTEEGDAQLDADIAAISSIDHASVTVLPKVVNVYGINGALLRQNVKAAQATKGLPSGLYIIGGQKVLVK